MKNQNKKFGLDGITYRASQIWETVSEEIKNSTWFPISFHVLKRWRNNLKYYYEVFILENMWNILEKQPP